MSLFEKAKNSTPEEVIKTKDFKTRVRIESEDFFNNIIKLSELQDNMKKDKAKAEVIYDELRNIAKDEWIKLYDKNGSNPGSVILESINDFDDKAQFMYVPSDKYISINASRADELILEYGDEIIDEKTIYSFDDTMIEKYGEILSKLIEDCSYIEEEDKEKIIKAVTTYSIAKGTINKFILFGNTSELFEATKPVVALKNIEFIKA